MWPFRSREDDDRPCEATVIRRKLKACKKIDSSWKSCVKANASESACQSLKESFRHCQARVLCPELAREYEGCMVKEVTKKRISHGEIDTAACRDVMRRIERCLSSRKFRAYLEDRN